MRTDPLISLVQSLLPTGSLPTLKPDVTPSHTNFCLQLENHSPTTLTGISSDAASAPVGINPECGILKAGQQGSLGNIANMIVCGLSMIVVLALIVITTRRRAAVGAFLSTSRVWRVLKHTFSPGRSEFRIFLLLYFFSLLFQLLSTGAVLEQGTTTLVAFTALHAGTVAALFWTLLGNALVSTQVVEDGTLSSLIVRLASCHITLCDVPNSRNFPLYLQPLCFFALAFFGVTTYISFDVALTITSTFGPSNPPSALHSIPLFVLTSVWPGAYVIPQAVGRVWTYYFGG